MYQITDECIGCGLCQMNCPVEAIHMGEWRREINQERCIHCGTCCDGCPVEAIKQS